MHLLLYAGTYTTSVLAPAAHMALTFWSELLRCTQQRWWQSSSPLGAVLIGLVQQMVMPSAGVQSLGSTMGDAEWRPSVVPGSLLACAMAGLDQSWAAAAIRCVELECFPNSLQDVLGPSQASMKRVLDDADARSHGCGVRNQDAWSCHMCTMLMRICRTLGWSAEQC